MMKPSPLLEIIDLHKHFESNGSPLKLSKSIVHALNGVDLCVNHGEILGIVGESGSGKSTLARCIVGLERPTSGTIKFNGEDVSLLQNAALRQFRLQVQLVFPDPGVALNPMIHIGSAIAEPMIAHRLFSKSEARRHACQLLEQVGLTANHYDRFPQELSTGQRHRAILARALAVRPRLLILDEPFSSLDVISKARLTDLLLELKRQYELTLICISHDLGFVRAFCERIVEMRRG